MRRVYVRVSTSVRPSCFYVHFCLPEVSLSDFAGLPRFPLTYAWSGERQQGVGGFCVGVATPVGHPLLGNADLSAHEGRVSSSTFLERLPRFKCCGVAPRIFSDLHHVPRSARGFELYSRRVRGRHRPAATTTQMA